jgi:hypothetical protein
MNLLSVVLSLSLLVFSFTEAVALHRATVCRQKAWLRSTELLTAATLVREFKNETSLNVACQTAVNIDGRTISWLNTKTFKKHLFEVDLKGNL